MNSQAVSHTQQQVQDKRDGLELTLLVDSPGGKAVIRTFEDMLTDYMLQFLNPELSDQETLWLRAKAIGLVETLNKMGVKISSVHDAPIRRAARIPTGQSFGY